MLGSDVGIVTGYWWTGWEELCLSRMAKVVRAGERKRKSDWLMVDGLWSVVCIATGYGFTGWGV